MTFMLAKIQKIQNQHNKNQVVAIIVDDMVTII
jgi:hypothetical protein